MVTALAMYNMLFVAAVATWVYRWSRDPFHPAVFLAPLFVIGYGFWPLALNREGALEQLFAADQLLFVSLLYSAGLSFLYAGLAWKVPARLHRRNPFSPWAAFAGVFADEAARRKVLKAAIVLALIASAAYWFGIFNVGGLSSAYAGYKGGPRAGSGWIDELSLLAYPAALFYGVYRQGKRVRPLDLVILALMVSPGLLHGFLGTRRGPVFIALAVFFLSWIIARGRAPRLKDALLPVTVAFSAMLLIWTQRRSWVAQDARSIDTGLFVEHLLPNAAAVQSHDYVSGVARAVMFRVHESFYWGYRFFVEFVIRPIPRQIWPSKYEDVGAFWKVRGVEEFSSLEYQQTLGFAPPQGFSVGIISDLYSEFALLALLALFAFGWFLRWLWIKHRTLGRVWTTVLLLGLGLGIYLPTQSFAAWMARFLLMGAGTLLFWYWVVDVESRQSVRRRLRQSLGPGARGEI